MLDQICGINAVADNFSANITAGHISKLGKNFLKKYATFQPKTSYTTFAMPFVHKLDSDNVTPKRLGYIHYVCLAEVDKTFNILTGQSYTFSFSGSNGGHQMLQHTAHVIGD